MSELRAEDVREALEWIDALHPNSVFVKSPVLPPLVAAAREWLASQEQKPDYEAALAELRSARPEWTEYVGDPFVVQNIVDAALVGFHPQPEGDETPDPDPQRVPADWAERLSKLRAREDAPVESPEVPT